MTVEKLTSGAAELYSTPYSLLVDLLRGLLIGINRDITILPLCRVLYRLITII